MTSEELACHLTLALAASKELLESLRHGQPPSDESLARRGHLLQEIAGVAPSAPADDHSSAWLELAGLDEEIQAAAQLYRASLAMEAIRLQKERTVLRFAACEPEAGSALTLSA